MENMKINWKLLQKAKSPRSQQEIGCREIENILKTAEKSWNFRWKLQNRTAGESKPSPNHPTKKSNRLKTVGHLYKMRFKNDTSILLFLHDTTKKKPMTSFLSWAYGGKKGIRTLEGFRGPTRFPVVRLRPAQPSFHIFSCAAPNCMSYYSNTNFKCQALFCIFLQKNLRWARCMQNVRANCIFCTFCPLANGGARC